MLAMALLLLIVLALAWAGFKRDLAAAKKNISAMHSQVYKSKNGNIEYVLTGVGPVVLVSHGITGGVDQGLGLCGMYLGAGYRTLYVSRFGYLRSSLPAAPSATLQADAYRELLDFLGIDGAFVLGNSAGGPSAIRFAIGYPERCKGLILISSAVPQAKAALPPRPVARAVFGSDFVYWCAIKLFGKSMAKMFVPTAVWESLSKAERKDLIAEIYLSGLPISSRTGGVLFDMYLSNLSMNDKIPYERIESPTLIIHARDDPGPPIAGARMIAQRIANSELAIYEKGGHLILGHEGEIKKRIREFIMKNPGIVSLRDLQLLEILKIGHDTSMRGAGISLRQALRRASYRELRPGFNASDLLPLIRRNPSFAQEWLAYSEDKRTSGGWYLSQKGEIGQVGAPPARMLFTSLEEAVAEYVVRELDFWAGA